MLGEEVGYFHQSAPLRVTSYNGKNAVPSDLLLFTPPTHTPDFLTIFGALLLLLP